jgi:hypothetical protein
MARKKRSTKDPAPDQPNEGFRAELRDEAEVVYVRYTRNVERLSELIQKAAGLGFTLGAVILAFSASKKASPVIVVTLLLTIGVCIAAGVLAAISIHKAQTRDDAMSSALFPAVLDCDAKESALVAAAETADAKRGQFDPEVEKYNQYASIAAIAGIVLFLLSVLLAAVW